MTTQLLPIHDGTYALLDKADYERASSYKWKRTGGTIYANIDSETVTLGRFILGLTEKDEHACRHEKLIDVDDRRCYNFLRSNLVKKVVTSKRQYRSSKKTKETTPPIKSTPSLITTPPPSATMHRPQFINVDGEGLIVNIYDIAEIDVRDPDIVSIRHRTQQFNQQTGRDTVCITYVFEGEVATRIRAWAALLLDESAEKFINMAVHKNAAMTAELEAALARADAACTETAAAEARLEKVLRDLDDIGFDTRRWRK